MEKLKDGQLDILVATDIAARGLDVPRISHVFNYDLPEGPEAYTHRIGRTGRAGRKGEAIIFLSRSQQGKLRFIEKITRQKIEVVDPPQAAEINKMRIKRFHESIDQTITNRDMTFFKKLVSDFMQDSEHSIEDVAAAIAMIGQNGKDFLMKDRPFHETKDRKSHKRSESGSGGKWNSGPEPGMSRFRIAVGKRDGVRPGNIVGAVTNEAEIDGNDIGSIRIHHSYSTIDLPTDQSSEILERLSETRVSGRPIRICASEDRPDRRNRSFDKGDRKRKPNRSKSKGRKGKPNSHRASR